MNIKYVLILAKEEDYEFIYELKKNAYKKYVEMNFGKWNEEQQREFFQKFVNAYKDDMYIIYLDNVKVGFYQCERRKNGDYEVGNICIVPEYQGMGIGTKILTDILEKYKEKDIHIQYFKQNPVGNLYMRLGFENNGETNYHYQMIKRRKNKEYIYGNKKNKRY